MKILLPILVFCFAVLRGTSQQKPNVLTPPALQTIWAGSKGGTQPLEVALNMIDSPVVVVDDKKVRYTISRFIVLYRSRDRYEDEETGKIKVRFNNQSKDFRNTPLMDEKWRKTIYESLKAGDQLLISDIIVRDKKGNYYKSPDIQINVE